jgi:uncharacterized protein YggT (Ycf19 family)
MLLFWAILKALCELIVLSYLAMLVVGIFNWKKRLGNPVYKFFDLVASPMTKLARLITPAAVSEPHTRVVGAFLAAVVWMLCTFELAQSCRENPADPYCVRKLEGTRQ